MHFNYRKSLALCLGIGAGLGGLLWGYSHTQTAHFRTWKGHTVETASGSAPVKSGSNSGLLGQEGDIRALRERDVRGGRSPAFVPGSAQDLKLKAFVDHAFADPKIASTNTRLKEFFPDTVPMNRWIRAAMIIGSLYTDVEMTPESFESVGKVYAQVLDGDSSAIASLQAGLQTLPQTEGAFRQQAFHMLSDIGMKNPSSRDAVRDVLLSEATRAGSHSDGTIAFTSLLRMNPTKEGYREVARAYEKLHPGSDLSDFVSLNVANL
jgi:hypothetical protein